VIAREGHQFPAGLRARQLDGRRCHGRSILREFDHVMLWHEREKSIRHLELEHRRTLEIHAAIELRLDLVEDRLVCVPQAHGGEPHRAIEELIAVDVPDARSLAVVNRRRSDLRELIVALGVSVGSARHKVVYPRGKRLRLRVVGDEFGRHCSAPLP
jgi:hypothetical protein